MKFWAFSLSVQLLPHADKLYLPRLQIIMWLFTYLVISFIYLTSNIRTWSATVCFWQVLLWSFPPERGPFGFVLALFVFGWGWVGFLLFADLLFFFGQETMKWSICYLIVLYSHSQGPWYWIGVLESSPGRSSTSRTYYSSYGTRSSTMRRWARCTVCSPGAETPRSWKPRWWCSFGLKTGK